MHNCRLTKNRLLDLALDEVTAPDDEQLLAELDQCRACREEYGTLRNTLRVSSQALQSALPAEDFWPGHHARLQAKLKNNLSTEHSVRQPWPGRVWDGLKRIATTSVRVPAPAALAIIVLMGILFFALPASVQRDANPAPPLATVEIRTLEVPVIQEKLVTKVVYVEKKGRRSRGTTNQLDRPDLNGANNVARVGWERSGQPGISLVGFKPTDQLKLTIIKRGQNEK